MRRAERMYRRLVALAGRELEGEYADEMTALFLHRLDDTDSPGQRLAVWLRAGFDLVRHGRSRPEPGRRPIGSPPPGDTGQKVDLGGLWADLRSALRLLLREPAVSLVIVTTLALGIGGVTALFSLVDGVLLRPLPYESPERLVLMYEAGEDGRPMPVSYPNFADWRERSRSFSALTLVIGPSRSILFAPGPPRPVRLLGVGRDFFETLGVRLLLGRAFTVEENAPDAPAAVVVSHELWSTALGANPDLDELVLDFGDNQVPVVGVAPPGFRFLRDADVWYPAEANPIRLRAAGNYPVLGRLAPGVSLQRAQEEMDAIAARIKEEYPTESLSEAVWMQRLHEAIVGDSRPLLWMLSGAASLVLLIACANIASTLLARGARRAEEVSIRRALGARRWRIVRQLLVEGFVLALFGAVVGLGVAYAALGWVRATGGADLPRLAEVAIDLRVLAFTGLVAMGTTLLFGLFPAWKISGQTGAAAGGGRSVVRGWNSGAWPVLVAMEVALALVLLVGAGLLIRSLGEILTVDAGYDSTNVLTVEVTMPQVQFPDDEAVVRFHREIGEELAALPGVEAAGVSSNLPLQTRSRSGPVLVLPYDDPEDPDEWDAQALLRVAAPGYFDAMDIRLLQGRLFGRTDDPDGPGVVVVNDSLAARLWPGENPLGKQLRALWDFDGEHLTVIGVVEEARHWSRDPGTQPTLYLAYWQRPVHARGGFIAVRTRGEPAAVQSAVERILEERDLASLTSVSPLRERFRSTLEDRTFVLGLLGAFAGIALALSLVGIYGVVAYSVAQRRREIGIRIALGATTGSVRRLVQRQTAMAVLVGSVVGVSGSLLAVDLVSDLLFRIQPLDSASFISATLLLLFAAGLASYPPARRSSRIDPAVALRAE